MSDGGASRRPGRLESISAVKLALLARQTFAEVEDILGAEPIAVIGMGCRFPGGADSTEAFWDLLLGGSDAVTEVPPDRWDADALYDQDFAAPGKTNSRRGGFLRQIDGFDAAFFGISPREAARMDPQHRLLLEVVYEALEDAGLPNERLSGSQTGVFIATSHNDYAQMQYSDASSIDVRTLTGTLHSIAANRVSFLLDLHGPSLTVDTACSSSLVAVHLAVQSLRARESHVSLAGGVSLIIGPEVSIALSKVGLMSPDGCCHTFDARANGFVRGEGCGVVVLKRLADALADGDRIRALIRGSAVNQDGRSTVLTAPNGLAQQAVVRAAIARAGVRPEEVGLVEAHGTGTLLGDPIEVEALTEVLAPARGPSQRCALTSVKTNLGHLEAAAGIAGLIKAVLSLEREAIPPHLHLTEPNPHISLERSPFFIPTKVVPWPAGPKPRYAGVSSFGVGGTNAHVVLAEAPRLPAPTIMEIPRSSAPPERVSLLPISARSPEALTALAGLYGRLLARGDDRPSLNDVCYSASVRRTHFEHRLAVAGSSPAQVAKHLSEIAESPPGPLSLSRIGTPEPPQVAFVFAGQGSQWWAMGRGLLEQEPTFRQVIQRCDELLRPLAGWSLLEELGASEVDSRLDQTEVAQPAIFALQVGLAALWRSWGIEPAAVVGHSVGEIAAAHTAGILDLEDSVRLVYHRGRLMQRATGNGRMAAVELSLDDTGRLIAPYGNHLAIAAVNGPGATVVSGETAAVAEVLARLERNGVRHHDLGVNYAFHSSQMATHAEALRRHLAELRPRRSQVRFYSTVTGRLAEGIELSADYWDRNVRQTVLFADAVASLVEAGSKVFLEIGPHPVLSSMVTRCLEQSPLGADGAAVVPSLRRNRPDRETLLTSLGQLYQSGCSVTWKALYPDGGRQIALPLYPWQRQRHWLETTPAAASPSSTDGVDSGHPLLGRPLRSPAILGVLFQSEISLTRLPYLADHQIAGRVVYPAAAILEMALSAAPAADMAGCFQLEDVGFHNALVLDKSHAVTVQLHLVPETDGGNFKLYGLTGGKQWLLHASGRLKRTGDRSASPSPLVPGVVLDRCGHQLAPSHYYAEAARRGSSFGPSFQGIEQLWLGEKEVLAQVQLPDAAGDYEESYGFHPALLDAALQPLGALLSESEQSGEDGLVVSVASIAEMSVHNPARGRLWSHVRLRRNPSSGSGTASRSLAGDVWIYDEQGRAVVEVKDLRISRVTPNALLQVSVIGGDDPAEWLLELRWQPKPLAARPPRPVEGGLTLVFADRGGTGRALARRLEALGEQVRFVSSGTAYQSHPSGNWTVDPTKPEHFLRLLRELKRRENAPLRRVVHFWALDVPQALESNDPLDSQVESVGSVLHTVKALATVATSELSGLWLVTRGAQSTALGSPVAAEQAGLWGLGATLALEQPDLRCVCVDLDPFGQSEQDGEQLATEILTPDSENQIAWHEGTRQVRRLTHAQTTPISLDSTDATIQLAIPTRGVLDNLVIQPLTRRPLGAGEVEIRVHAAGLNFRDVLKALDQYSWDHGPLGDECAGEVVALGPGVDRLSIGQRVVAFASGSFAAYTVARAGLVIPLPDALSYEEAASLPIAFTTAYYTLIHLAEIKKGERVLIHAAAGGVGLAAVQLAQRLGAEVFATAGSLAKRDYLRSLGIVQVFDSRSLGFAEEVLAATAGRGVDVVLNSLAGEFIAKSLSILSPNGRFLELGRKGIWSADQVSESAPGVTYFPVFLGDEFDRQPRLIQTILGELVDLVATGELRQLPRRLFPLSDAVNAFRLMAQARHVGKVVLTFPVADRERAADGFGRLRSDGTYLITGGLGGIGRSVARGLVARGAHHLILLGRRGADTPESKAFLDELLHSGAEVVVAQADVADRSQVAHVLKGIEASGSSLRGVIHAAGVIDDGVLVQQTWGRFAKVMESKVRGAWNLHVLCQYELLDFFVTFSSVAAIQGSPGQGSYAAANAYLDALAHQRHSLGLPALSINWGPWGESGMAARLGGDRDRWARQGLGVIEPDAGIRALALALGQSRPQIVVTPIARDRLAEGNLARGCPLWSELARETAHRTLMPAPARKASPGSALLHKWAATPPGQRRSLLMGFIQNEAIRVIGLPGETIIDARRPFRELGLDSLMAVELRNVLSRALATSLPTTLVFDYPTAEALVGYLIGHVPALAQTPTDLRVRPFDNGPTSDTPGRLDSAPELARLSDDEAAELLLVELEQLGGGG